MVPPAPRRLGGRIATVVVASLLAACTSTVLPSPSPTISSAPSHAPTAAPATASPGTGGSVDPVYGLIAAQVEQIRGLRATADITPVVIDQATLRQNLEADFNEANPAEAVEASERILKALGLLPPDGSLRDEVIDLQAGQVIGYYSPERDELFVVSSAGGVGPTQRATYAHEYTHQLQDQNFGLDKLGFDATDQGDRSLGRLALVEGDAVTAQTRWMQANLSANDLGQIVADAADPAVLEALQKAPAILRETAFFPYQEGAILASALMVRSGYQGVDAAYADPPDSTEQVLHPEKYLDRDPPAPVVVPADLPTKLGAGWSAGGADTIGELQLRIWLHEGGVPSTVASRAAAGWGGDRLMLLDGPAGATAIALITEWDTPADADEFAAAARSAIGGLNLSGLVSQAGRPTQVRVAIGAQGAEVLAALGG
ncbi:MAG: hypothetical protein ACAH65_02385 [Chloroflexota bacterium]